MQTDSDEQLRVLVGAARAEVVLRWFGPIRDATRGDDAVEVRRLEAEFLRELWLAEDRVRAGWAVVVGES